MKARILALSLVVALAGCAGAPVASGGGTSAASPIATTAATTVFAATSAYDAALVAGTAYKRLPTCSATQKLPCSDPSIVAQMNKAESVAASALDAAQSAVRTPAVGATAIESALNAASAATTAFSSILATLGVNK